MTDSNESEAEVDGSAASLGYAIACELIRSGWRVFTATLDGDFICTLVSRDVAGRCVRVNQTRLAVSHFKAMRGEGVIRRGPTFGEGETQVQVWEWSDEAGTTKADGSRSAAKAADVGHCVTGL